MGLEPTRSCDHRHLKPARLPIPPLLRIQFLFAYRLCRSTKCMIPAITLKVNTFFQIFEKNYNSLDFVKKRLKWKQVCDKLLKIRV